MVTCNAITLDMSIFGFSIILGFLFILIRYLFAEVVNDERGKMEAKYLTGELILSIIIVLFMAAILNHATSQTDNNNVFIALVNNVSSSVSSSSQQNLASFGTSQSGSLTCKALAYLKNMSANAMDLYKANLWAAMVAGQLSTFTYSINAAIAFTEYISINLNDLRPMGYLGKNLEKEFSSQASNILNVAVLPLISQFYILMLFVNNELLKLFPLIILFRVIPVFKGFANVLFSVIVSFVIVMPLIIYAESFIFKLDNLNVNSITEYTDNLNAFSIVLNKPVKEAVEISKGVISQSWPLGSESNPLTLYLEDVYFKVDKDNKVFKFRDKALIKYDELMKKNARVIVAAAFLSAINIIALVVSIRSLQLLFGDTTENLFEMFMRWV
ncbi:MAG: hypothetical protein QXS91_03635 [Candidatus Anstonellales archaeon]